jgi:hypothetical protein
MEGLDSTLFSGLTMMLFKTCMITVSLMYLAFAAVVLKQTKLMLKVIEANMSGIIYTIALLHLFASIFILIWAILYL